MPGGVHRYDPFRTNILRGNYASWLQVALQKSKAGIPKFDVFLFQMGSFNNLAEVLEFADFMARSV
jgi:hypothetical protein